MLKRGCGQTDNPTEHHPRLCQFCIFPHWRQPKYSDKIQFLSCVPSILSTESLKHTLTHPDLFFSCQFCIFHHWRMKLAAMLTLVPSMVAAKDWYVKVPRIATICLGADAPSESTLYVPITQNGDLAEGRKRKEK